MNDEIIKNKLKEFKIAALYYINRFHPIEPHKIVFQNYNGKGYGCNPKYIAEELIRRHSDWDYVWLSSSPDSSFPNEIRYVPYDSNAAIYELATAGVWIDNQRKLWYHRKRKKQFFIATWHGAGIPIKKLGIDNPNNIGSKPYEHTSKHMNKIADLMISNSKACTEIFHRAFLYEREILNCGYPRNDIFFKDSSPIKKKVREYYSLRPDEHLVLYAPTYRNGRKTDLYDLDCSAVIDALTKRYGGTWRMLLRLHPSMREKACHLQSLNIINVSLYEDIQELLVTCDVLISDYSSIITEFALTKKPVFLYATDIKDYRVERDFYCDYFHLPFPVSENNLELEKNIISFDEKKYYTDLEHCFNQYGIAEYGTASATLADIIEKRIENQ